MELQTALATAVEQERLAKEENDQLREKLASLQVELSTLRREMAQRESFEDAGVESLGLNYQNLGYW